jgi:hypothetical protein
LLEAIHWAATGVTFAVYLAVTLLGIWRWGRRESAKPGMTASG